MKTVTIDIINDKALNLLKELEALNLIRLLYKEEGVASSSKKPSDFKGIISPELADQLQEQVRQSRNQWERI